MPKKYQHAVSVAITAAVASSRRSYSRRRR